MARSIPLRPTSDPQPTHEPADEPARVGRGPVRSAVEGRAALAGASPALNAARVKALAFFLPQFHPIPENDLFWGPGFTEWTGVATARPWFEGHHQPLVPADLGFYDLRLAEVREQQAALAGEYGIHGFCYYYYSFSGKRLLSRPLDEVLATGRPDFPFCLCWANENWTRSWDGQHQDVLIAQEHTPEDDARFIDEVLPALLDPRYVRCDGKPLLLVYRADCLADPLSTTSMWREKAVRAGLPGLHLCAVWNVEDPLAIGFDALVEFPPHRFPHQEITDAVERNGKGFEGAVFDYAAGVERIEPLPDLEHTVYRGVMPGWDNTPRRGRYARVFFNSSPEAYGRWLAQIVRETGARPGTGDQFVFINAWNEWGEGAVLEPSRRHGRAYLEATRSALEGRALAEVRGPGPVAPSEERPAPPAPPPEATPPAPEMAPPGPGPPGRRGESSLRRELWLSPHYGLLVLLAKLPLWLLAGRLPSRLSWCLRARALLREGSFDSEAYLERHPEVGRQGIDALYHYVRYGEETQERGEVVPPAPLPRGAWRIQPEHARSRSADSRPILVVSHDAALAGSQLILLETVTELAKLPDLEIFVLLMAGGELEGRFASRVHTLCLDELAPRSEAFLRRELDEVLGELLSRRPLFALCNTVLSHEAAAACRRAGVPVLSFVYELPTTIEATVGRRGLLSLVASSDAVIVASRFVQRALARRYGLDPERLRMVHSGALEWDNSEGWRRRCRAAVLSELGLPPNTFLVLGCGTVHHRKGTDLFVQVAREVLELSDEPHSRFVWIGADQDGVGFRRWCEHDIAAAGLAGRVRLAGPREDPSPYFGAADAFALTSREDPFPMVVLEAMARGVPVVAFAEAGGAPEVLADGAGIVVPYLDLREMARALVSLREAPGLHAAISREARGRIERHYSWPGYIERLLGVFESELGYRRRTATRAR